MFILLISTIRRIDRKKFKKMITTTIFGTLIIFIGRILATNSGKPIFKTLSLTLGLIILIGVF